MLVTYKIHIFAGLKTKIMEFKTIIIDDTYVTINSDGTVVYVGKKLVKISFFRTKPNSKGFRVCTINRNKYYIHKLVALAFVSNPNNLPFTIHIDTNTLNNDYTNLTWGDRKHVARCMHVMKRYHSSYPKEDTLSIIKRLDKGETARSIAKEYNVSEMTIDRIRRKHCKVKVASPRYSDDIKNVAIELYKSGESTTEISKKLNIRYDTVLRWVKSFMVYKGCIRYDDVVKQQIIQEMQNGSTYKDIMTKLNLPYSIVWRVCKECKQTISTQLEK